MKIKYCRFANSIKVGPSEITSGRADLHDIHLVSSTVLRIKDKKTGDVAFSSLFNTIFWTVDETELQMEAEGFGDISQLDMTDQPLKNKGGRPPKKVTA